MSNINGLIRRVDILHKQMYPTPKPVKRLPVVFLDDDLQPLPGYEDGYRRAEMLGVAPKVYIGVRPDDDGGVE